MTQSSLPRHIAVIMDGNGRWARERGLPRSDGHRAGMKSVRLLVEECCRLGVGYLTLFSFSTENWHRSFEEVSHLMALFKEYLESELSNPELLRNGVRLRTIGDVSRLPLPIRLILNQVEERTKKNDRLELTLAVSYGGREEIVSAARGLAKQVAQGTLRPDDIDEALFSRSLWASHLPDPDLFIRTGGEQRISNFLLWQLAYTELIILDRYWPDFSQETFSECLQEYARRERRFGRTSEQLQTGQLQSGEQESAQPRPGSSGRLSESS